MNLSPKQLRKSLETHTTAISYPKGRMVGSPGHDKAREYIRGQMESLGLDPFHGDSYELPYTGTAAGSGKRIRFTNLVGVIPGRDRSLPPILVGAHYDSVIDAPCADDNATSVAFTLALAENHCASPLERDLIIAFFDAEEPPYYLGPDMGSNRFYQDFCKGRKFAAVLITDLIGHDAEVGDLGIKVPAGMGLLANGVLSNLSKLLAVMGAESDGTFPAIIEAAAKDASGLSVIATLSEYIGPVSDHAAFAKAGQPFLFLSCGRGKYYHTPQDDLTWINFDKLAHITRFAADIIGRIDRTPAKADRTPFDPVETELRLFRKFGGMTLPLILKSLGIKTPESRKELEALLSKII